MEKVKTYLREVLGQEVYYEPINKGKAANLPFYIKESFSLFNGGLLNQVVLFAALKNDQQPTTWQLEKQVQNIKKVINKKIVLVLNHLPAIDRKKLIQKGINFIVPGTQLFLPDFLIDLRETYTEKKQKKERLLPSAQFILLYKILHPLYPIERMTFKQLASRFQYTPMGISKAIIDLKNFDLCTTEGTKEKYIRFNRQTVELWNEALPYMNTPVIKRVFTDKRPEDLYLLKSNASALPEYTNMAPENQEYLAIEKTQFYSFQKHTPLTYINEREGQYCLEVWKYDPAPLSADITSDMNVDPLSLYLSMKDAGDERIKAALEQIIKQFIYNR